MRIHGRLVRRGLAAVAVATGLALAVTATPAAANHRADTPRILATILLGQNSVPANDSNGFGIAVILVQPAQDQVCYLVTQHKLTSAVTAAHIHSGAKGTNGPVVVPFIAPVDGKSKSCVTVADALATDLAQNPRNYYVNVHTTNFPAGEIRGQLV